MNEKNRPGTAAGTETTSSISTQSTTSRKSGVWKPPINQLIHDEVTLFFDTRDQSTCSPEDVELELLNRINTRLVSANEEYGLKKGKDAYQQLKALPPAVIAECILKRELEHTGLIGKSRATAELMTYEDKYEEPNKGLYVPAEDRIRSLAFQYNYMLSPKECDDVVKRVRYLAPLLKESEDPDVVALANGLFDLRSKELRDFSPKVVLTSKASVAFNPDATTCPLIDGWSVDEWIRELANNDPEVEKLFWQIIAALFRPGHSFDKAVLLYSPTGSNGKGTFLELLRNLVGVERVATLSMSDFDGQYLPEELRSAFCVLSDENEVGYYIKEAGKLKAWITHDWTRFNVKYGPMTSIKGRGLCVFCSNELPSSKDKSESLYRRLILIPFPKRYVGADENKAIKNDYVKRREVLEYVVYKALMKDLFDSLDVPAVCDELLDEMRVDNDPVLQFAKEFLPQFVWDFLPWDFVYGVYSAWMHDEVPSGRPVSSREFNKRLSAYVDDNPSCGWFVPRGAGGKQKKVRTKGLIIGEEPLAVKYDITNWFDIQPVNGSIRKVGTPHNIPISARGLQRTGISSTDDE